MDLARRSLPSPIDHENAGESAVDVDDDAQPVQAVEAGRRSASGELGVAGPVDHRHQQLAGNAWLCCGNSRGSGRLTVERV